MYRYTLSRLPYKPIFVIMFGSGISVGSILGLTLLLMNGVFIGVLGAAFIALLIGLTSGFLGLIYTAVFNTLSPLMGGFPLRIEELPVISTEDITPHIPDAPSN